MKSAREWAEWIDEESRSGGINAFERLASRIQADARAPLEEVLREAQATLRTELDRLGGPSCSSLTELLSRIEEALR